MLYFDVAVSLICFQVVSVAKKNANIALVFQFLHKIVQVMTSCIDQRPVFNMLLSLCERLIKVVVLNCSMWDSARSQL